VKIVSADYVDSAVRLDGMPKSGFPEVAMIGRSNVGKSSLINALLGRKNLARTSTAPGKTQMANFFAINGEFYLVDLPGLGYAKVSKRQRNAWERLIADYIGRRQTLRVVIHLFDSRRDPGTLDLAVTDMVRQAGRGYIVALTKIDKLTQRDRAASRTRLAMALLQHGLEPPIVETSARKRSGMKELWEWIDMLSKT
jgi:GTP-binding protein